MAMFPASWPKFRPSRVKKASTGEPQLRQIHALSMQTSRPSMGGRSRRTRSPRNVGLSGEIAISGAKNAALPIPLRGP